MIYWFPIMKGKDRIGEKRERERERELVQEIQMPDAMKV